MARRTSPWRIALLLWLALAGCVLPSPTSTTPTARPAPTTAPPRPTASPPQVSPTNLPAIPATAPPSPPPPTPLRPADPYDLISRESLLQTLEDLTAIQPYSGWRNSATQGEAEALDYVTRRLGALDYLRGLGLELERQPFTVFQSTELWETRLQLTVNGLEIEVPADGLRGLRDSLPQALRFDSDGALNDDVRNPIALEGPVVWVGSEAQVHSLRRADVEGRIVLLDYAVIDRITQGTSHAVEIASELLARGPAGLVLVTHYTNERWQSHGAFIGDLSALSWVEGVPAVPTLYVRIEDMAAAGITAWEDLSHIEAAHLTWDADVFAPGTSANLVARIPGVDPTAAVILGAHIDSPNSPGAMDDGSGSAVLLELARVLDTARVQPPVDLILVWFGSEELSLYGSGYFANTHQDLLDRSLAMLQVDCLAHPLEGIEASLNLVSWPYSWLGDDRTPWPDYLTAQAADEGIHTQAVSYTWYESDNSVFSAYGVPNANLIYSNDPEMEQLGGFHYAGQVHSPYDTVDLAREVADVLEEMARVALSAALETGGDRPALRVAPPPERRALFVASHTEPVHMTAAFLTNLGMALTWEGYDVDQVPYGEVVTSTDLEGVDLVIVLPVVDYPSPEGDPNTYDEAWTGAEIAALEGYAAEGGLLLLTNSAHRLKYNNRVLDGNEDWADVNPLAQRFGVTFHSRTIEADVAWPEGAHPLIEGISQLALAAGNCVPFDLSSGEVLALAGGCPVVALVEHGRGQVLVLGDMGILNGDGGEPVNLPFWSNLARFGRE